MPYVHRPRAIVRLNVPIMGSAQSRTVQATTRETVTIDVVPTKARLEKNGFNEADECNLTFQLDQSGVDPRLLGNANVAVVLEDQGTGPEMGWRDNAVRFTGIVVSCRRKMGPDGNSIEMRCLDYTHFFLKQKPLIPRYVPDLSQSLSGAWERICDGVGLYDYDRGEIASSVSVLRDRLEFRGLDDAILGDAAFERVRRNGKLQVSPGTDAWGVWKACCDSLGLYTWIDRDRCIVSTASDYYTSGDTPIFRYGLNVRELDEYRDLQGLSGRGIHLLSYDPIGGSTIEAFWPPRDEGIVVKKRLPAKQARMGGESLAPIQDYESHVYPHASVVTPEVLELAAERIYEERSRQELEGTLTTDDMRVDTLLDTGADMLDISHGDSIRVEIAQDAEGAMRSLATMQARQSYLTERGYDPNVAKLMAEDAGFLSRLLPVFVVKRVSHDFDGEKVGTSIDFASRINPNGSTE